MVGDDDEGGGGGGGVLSWFRELESYRRIDVLCGLLNMCLPFELRFAGAYVEELGKRDFRELRGAELRANNPDELEAECGAARGDPRAPRRMALYVSLLRSCNAACARTLHAALLGLERAGLLRQEPLDELLLLYTMALHHPAFTFDQREHYGAVLAKLKQQQQLRPQQQQQQPQQQQQQPQQQQQQPQPHQQQQQQTRRPGPSTTRPGSAPPLPQSQQPAPPVQRLRYVYLKQPGAPRTPEQQQQQPGDIMPSPQMGEAVVMPILHEVVQAAPPPPTAFGVPQQYSIVEYGVPPHPHWPEGTLMMHEIPPEMISYASQPSPLISQPASPCDSRPVSPNMQVPPPPSRQPSRQTQDPAAVPLPPLPHDVMHLQQQQQQQLAANFNHLTISEIRQMDDERLHEMGFPPNAVTQLRSIEKLNGMPRSSSSRQQHGGGGGSSSSSSSKGHHHHPPPPPAAYLYPHQHQQQPQPQHQHPSSGSEESSSTGSRSPPDTPAPPAPAPLGPGRPRPPSSPLYLQQQQQPPPPYVVPPHSYARSAVYPAFATYRPPPPPSAFPPFATANGETPAMYAPGATQLAYVPVQIYDAQPKVASCWNCGSVGHAGAECKEPSIEEVTRPGCYQLDYSTAPPDVNDK